MTDHLKDFLETTALKERADLPPPSRRPNRRRFYSIRQAAFELGVSDRTLWRWIADPDRKIETYRLSIGRVGIPVDELDRIEKEILQRGKIER